MEALELAENLLVPDKVAKLDHIPNPNPNPNYIVTENVLCNPNLIYRIYTLNKP
mgnify:CR=1 FL=1